MKRTGLTAVLLMLLFAGALALRLSELDLRPMHTDEAVQADKSGTLLETGRYVYNPHEYHGPALHYMALPSMWFSGGRYEDCGPATFRVVPAVLGALMVLFLFYLRDGLGTAGVLCAGVLLACSPSMVFYNRYYIAETPLVFGSLLALASGWRYLQKPCTGWAVLTAVGVAVMYTTKETWAFSTAAAAGALLLNFVFFRKTGLNMSSLMNFLQIQRFERRHFGWAALTFAAIGVLLFSAFFTNIRGPVDSVATYVWWGKKALGEKRFKLDASALAELRKAEVPEPVLAKLAPLKDVLFESRSPFLAKVAVSLDDDEREKYQPLVLSHATVMGPHVHRWNYFPKLLAFNRYEDKFIWTEGLILLLAFVGALSHLCGWNPAHANTGFVRFLTFYSLLLAAIYTVIPYKTPWCVLGFHLGFILLAGAGAATIVAGALRLRPKILAGVVAGLATILLLAGTVHLCRQTRRANFVKYCVASRRNPYVYGHTGPNAIDLVKRIEELMLLAPEGKDAVVLVVAAGNDYWPLPYYLRRLKRTGFIDQPPADWARYNPAVVAFLHDPEAKAPIVPPKGYETTGFFGLRPTVNFVVLARPDVFKAWRAAIEARSK